MKKNASCWIFLSVFIIALDQFTKYLVLCYITRHTVIRIFPFLNLILRFNSGASFSFLSNVSGWQIYLLSTVSITVSVILIVWLCYLKRSEWMTALPVSLVLGGAIGNLIDRVRYGFVTDFVDFHIGHWHFATFNVADSAVSIGATWLVLRLLYESFARKS